MNREPLVPGSGPGSNPDSGESFRKTLGDAAPPGDWDAPFRALWWDAQGNWEAAHDIAQDLETTWGSRMHAYLHRKEGDLWNARYWYRRAGIAPCDAPLDAEFEILLRELL